MVLRALVLLVTLLTALAAADDPWRYFDQDAKFLMGVQWRRILDSPAGAQLRRQMQDGIPMLPVGGTKFLSSVDSVIIGSPGMAENAKGGQPPVLIVVSGQFDLAKVKASVSRKSRRAVVQNIEIFASTERGGGQQLGIALVSTETLLLGDLPTLVRTVGAAPSRWSNLIERARRLDGEKYFWMVSTVPPGAITGPNVPLPVPLPLEALQGVEIGVGLRDGFSLEMALDMESPDAAHQLKTQMEKAIRLAAREKSRPDMAGLDRFMKLEAAGEQVRMTFEIDAAELDRRMRAYEAQRRRGAGAVARVPEPPRPANSKPVIWNLDSGESQ